MTEVATLEKALSEAENRAVAERTERGKQEARVRAGEQTIWKRHRVCVWERGVRARERERGREGARGVVCVHKWRIDRETMLMLSEIGL